MEVLKLSGTSGNGIEVTDFFVRIRSKILTEKEKTVPFSSIISVQIQKPGFMKAGYIYFQTVGGLNNTKKITTDILRDENSWVLANQTDYEVAVKMKEKIEAGNTQAGNAQMTTRISDADEIMKYKTLLDAGAITQEEYDIKKKQLLGL